MNELIDSHCHIHSIGKTTEKEDYTHKKWRDVGETEPDKIIKDAGSNGVTRLVCVGTSASDSARAVDFVQGRDNCWAAVGAHPHDAVHESDRELQILEDLANQPKVVAIGEIGLDYHYEHSPRDKQKKLFEQLLGLAAAKDLPVIFHVREAYDDFWPIFDNFKGIRGVLHSFSATTSELDKALERGLYIGLNGIMTFTSDQLQLDAAKAVPLDRLLLETDAPYLTPKPFRGKICKPEHIRPIGEFLAQLRSEDFAELARQTTTNAQKLFKI